VRNDLNVEERNEIDVQPQPSHESIQDADKQDQVYSALQSWIIFKITLYFVNGLIFNEFYLYFKTWIHCFNFK